MAFRKLFETDRRFILKTGFDIRDAVSKSCQIYMEAETGVLHTHNLQSHLLF